MMCTSAAAAILRQCGREYGFSNGEALRATDISTLSPQELKGLKQLYFGKRFIQV